MRRQKARLPDCIFTAATGAIAAATI